MIREKGQNSWFHGDTSGPMEAFGPLKNDVTAKTALDL